MIIEDKERLTIGYTCDEGARNIRDNEVVRPKNGRWCVHGGQETHTWREKSTGRCPTYGSCEWCLMSGSLGQYCSECQIKNSKPRYVVLAYDQKLLDSIAIAELYHKGHQIAKADRYNFRGIDKIQEFNFTKMREKAEERFSGVQYDGNCNELINQLELGFERLLE